MWCAFAISCYVMCFCHYVLCDVLLPYALCVMWCVFAIMCYVKYFCYYIFCRYICDMLLSLCVMWCAFAICIMCYVMCLCHYIFCCYICDMLFCHVSCEVFSLLHVCNVILPLCDVLVSKHHDKSIWCHHKTDNEHTFHNSCSRYVKNIIDTPVDVWVTMKTP